MRLPSAAQPYLSSTLFLPQMPQTKSALSPPLVEQVLSKLMFSLAWTLHLAGDKLNASKELRQVTDMLNPSKELVELRLKLDRDSWCE